MRSQQCMRVTTAVLSGLLVVGTAGAAESDITAVGWLAGCWAPENGEVGSVEHWLQPAGGIMLGVSRTVKNGKTAEFEFMQLRVNGEGKLVFIALPSGQKEATFVATSIGEFSVTFENPQHDFPQKVSYRRDGGGGRLIGRIEGNRNGAPRAIEFRMRHVVCESVTAK
jgi:hypothetical protein